MHSHLHTTVKNSKCMACFFLRPFVAIKCTYEFYLPSQRPDLTKIKTVPTRERGPFCEIFYDCQSGKNETIAASKERLVGVQTLRDFCWWWNPSRKSTLCPMVSERWKACKEAGSADIGLQVDICLRWSRMAFMSIVSVNRWTRWSLPTTKRAIERKMDEDTAEQSRLWTCLGSNPEQARTSKNAMLPKMQQCSVQRCGEGIHNKDGESSSVTSFWPGAPRTFTALRAGRERVVYRPEVEKRVSMSSAAARGRKIS